MQCIMFFVLVFRASPPLPPSNAQAIQRAAENTSFIGPLKRLALNPGYILLLISYGINVGVFYAISTLLNQVVLEYFPVRLPTFRNLLGLFALVENSPSTALF